MKRINSAMIFGFSAVLLATAACATGDRRQTDTPSGQGAGVEQNNSEQFGQADPQSDLPSGTTETADTSGPIATTETDPEMNSEEQAGTTPAAGAKGESRDKAMSENQLANEMVLNRLHHINQKEIEMAKMAGEKAQSAEVKSAAQKIMTDHQQLDTNVQSIAKAQGIQLQDFQPATHEKAAMDRLGKLSGSQFDRAFAMNMHMGHQVAAEELRAVRKSVKDSQVRGLIDTALPSIQQHRKLSTRIHKSGARDQQAGIAAPQAEPEALPELEEQTTTEEESVEIEQ